VPTHAVQPVTPVPAMAPTADAVRKLFVPPDVERARQRVRFNDDDTIDLLRQDGTWERVEQAVLAQRYLAEWGEALPTTGLRLIAEG
jgi:hypothetical protein